MASIDVIFCRKLLQEAHKLVKLHFPEINLQQDAWTWTDGRKHWEFHGPNGFYWYGSADNGFDCRYKGWMAWLKQKGIE